MQNTEVRVERTHYEYLTIWEIITKLVSIPLPPKTTYPLQKNITELYNMARKVSEKRAELIKKYGVHNEETKTITVKKENDAFFEEYEKFMNEVSEVVICPIEISKFEPYVKGLITPAEMNAINFLVCDDKIIIEPIGSFH